MAVEIERKFLVTGTAWRTGDGIKYRQGYLNRHPERTVRVRVAGDDAWLTIKGLSEGPTRLEFEYVVPKVDAEQLLNLCERPLIEKTRHQVHHGGKTWEVDEFLEENAGLIIAEIELSSESEAFDQPSWLGKEVTDDARYFNSSLSMRPFKNW